MPLLERALAIEQANYGPNDARLAVTLNTLALLQGDRGAWRDAEPLLARAAAIDAARDNQLSAAANKPLSGAVVDRVDAMLGLPPNPY